MELSDADQSYSPDVLILEECNIQVVFYFSELQHCLYEPCRNGATCNETNIGKGYECLCDKFYGGPQCHTGNFWTVNIGYIWHDSPAF